MSAKYRRGSALRRRTFARSARRLRRSLDGVARGVFLLPRPARLFAIPHLPRGSRVEERVGRAPGERLFGLEFPSPRELSSVHHRPSSVRTLHRPVATTAEFT